MYQQLGRSLQGGIQIAENATKLDTRQHERADANLFLLGALCYGYAYSVGVGILAH